MTTTKSATEKKVDAEHAEAQAAKDQEAAGAKAAVEQMTEEERYAEEQRKLARKEAEAGKTDDLTRGDGVVALQDPSQPMANPPKPEEVHGEAQTAYSE